MEIKLRQEYGKLEDYVYAKRGLFKNKVRSPVPKEKGGKLKPDELPSAPIDPIFKHMFACEEGKINACVLIESVLDIDLKELYDGMVLYRNEVNKLWLGGKGERMDFVGLCDNVFFSIEMNNTNRLERNADYAGRLYSMFAKEGESEGEYMTVVQTNVNNFTIPSIDKTINISRVIDKEGRTRLRIIYIDIYLPHIIAKYKRGEELNRCERVVLMQFATSERLARKLAKGEKNMIKYIERLKGLKGIREKMEHYYEVANAHSEGREEGESIGYENGREEGESIGFERGETVGMEKGKTLGFEQGETAGMEKAATSMLEKGLAPELVQECTKLPWEKIKHIMTML